MRKDWNDKANENAYHWVDSSKKVWVDKDYYERGGGEAEGLFLDYLHNIEYYKNRISGMVALEIGCGTGRLVRRLSKEFAMVYGIDVSEEMITRAKRDNSEIKNAIFEIGNGFDLENYKENFFDFVYSYIVMQHLPSRVVVENYFREAYRVLKQGASIKIQVRGYPGGIKVGLAPYRFVGFNDCFIALSDKRGIPFPVVKKYNTLLGAFYKPDEIRKVMKKIGYKNIAIAQDPDNHRYLWTTAVK